MSRVVSIVAVGIALASVSGAQQIGKVTLKPDAKTGKMYVDLRTVRPDGEPVFIVRGGKVITDAVVESSGKPGGSVVVVPAAAASKVRVGDIISLSEDPKAPLSSTAPSEPSQRTVAAAPALGDLPPLSAVAPVPGPAVPPSLPPMAGEVKSLDALSQSQSQTTTKKITVEDQATQLEKGQSSQAGSVESIKSRSVERVTEAVSPALTPRSSGLTVYPRPAVTAEAGIIGPYGVGLAAAAPVGTPYLRSPAFAGPPIIYMPQTVTRVLLPGVTPYPANIMAPPVRYAYASAPFVRTDIYVNLPYGTFYWPQGYAGTTPVEPQVPAYVLAPSTAIQTNEASYTTQRYAPGLANPETLSPITAAASAPVAGAVVVTGPQPAIAALTPASLAGIAQIPAVVPGGPAAPIGAELSVAPAELPAEAAPALQPLTPFPSMNTNEPASPPTGIDVPASIGGPAPLALTPVPTPTTEVMAVTPGASAAPLPSLPEAGGTIPALPGTGTAPGVSAPPTLPTLPGATGATETAPPLPSLPTGGPAVGAPAPAVQDTSGIIADDKIPTSVSVDPPQAWENSVNLTESYQQSSLIGRVDGTIKRATFYADVPEDGEYEIFVWWVQSNKQFRSDKVPVTVDAAAGPQKLSVDQSDPSSAKRWNSIGKFTLKAGQHQPVVTLSTEGVEPGPTVSVSVDAMKLVKQ
ncbi:MAG: hypothetical protein ACR2IE_03005 [Candidatus Sumerlaeaceae bacterium]